MSEAHAGANGSAPPTLADLAGGIAQSLTQSREQGASETPESQVDEAEPAREPVDDGREDREPEPPQAAAEDAGDDGQQRDGEDDSSADEQPSSEPDRYSIADFADAAGVTGEDFESRLFVSVKDPDGATRDVSLAELRNGYRWNAANTQKAQEIAEQRKALEQRLGSLTEVQNQADAVIQAQYAALDREAEALRKQVEAVDWNELQQRQDGSYADARAQVQQANDAIQARRAELDRARSQVAESRAKQHEMHMAEVIPQARAKMLELVPEWSDPETAEREGRSMGEYAIRQGFTAEEYATCYDPRVLRLLRDAWLGSQVREQGAAAKRKVKDAPKFAVKPGRRRSAAERRGQERRDMNARVKQTGKATDLAALVLQGLKSERG